MASARKCRAIWAWSSGSSRCGRCAGTRPSAERDFSLHMFELARMKARLGPRWAEHRSRALAMLDAGLDREPARCDLRLDNGDTRYFAIRTADDRRDVRRQAELLAADVTARLCGTLPGGATIRVTTLAIDPEAALAGITSGTELLDRLEALTHRDDASAAAPTSTVPVDLCSAVPAHPSFTQAPGVRLPAHRTRARRARSHGGPCRLRPGTRRVGSTRGYGPVARAVPGSPAGAGPSRPLRHPRQHEFPEPVRSTLSAAAEIGRVGG